MKIMDGRGVALVLLAMAVAIFILGVVTLKPWDAEYMLNSVSDNGIQEENDTRVIPWMVPIYFGH